MPMKRNIQSLYRAIIIFGVVILLTLGLRFTHLRYDHDAVSHALRFGGTNVAAVSDKYGSDPPLKLGDATLLNEPPPYIQAIMNATDTTFPRFECPFANADRYAYLNGSPNLPASTGLPKYFFALDLYQCVHLLPRLLGSIVEAVRFLGPENWVLSVVEGRSDDGTFEVLKELDTELKRLGVGYHLQSSDINPTAEGIDRITALAELRNLALKDLLDFPDNYANDTTVIFSNDIAHPTFYDVWIARGMTGDWFFRIPEDGSWDYAWNLFWNDEPTQFRWLGSKPFQVFSCWNGITAFTARPIMDAKIKFRAHYEDECMQGEPKLFAKDLWWHGYGKIAVVPSVNVEYSDEAAKKIKELKGYVSRHVTNEGEDVKIEWNTAPPAQVKCMPGFSRNNLSSVPVVDLPKNPLAFHAASSTSGPNPVNPFVKTYVVPRRAVHRRRKLSYLIVEQLRRPALNENRRAAPKRRLQRRDVRLGPFRVLHWPISILAPLHQRQVQKVAAQARARAVSRGCGGRQVDPRRPQHRAARQRQRRLAAAVLTLFEVTYQGYHEVPASRVARHEDVVRRNAQREHVLVEGDGVLERGGEPCGLGARDAVLGEEGVGAEHRVEDLGRGWAGFTGVGRRDVGAALEMKHDEGVGLAVAAVVGVREPDGGHRHGLDGGRVEHACVQRDGSGLNHNEAVLQLAGAGQDDGLHADLDDIMVHDPEDLGADRGPETPLRDGAVCFAEVVDG
ncbi:cryptococcal mannosyltransferase 1-domain-containing protein [Massariosphaeria phaeospora]|uniref:Cryptococcal mannosyltransferase 1-domain-containing protein n=1 Tax=Massariosphaeria phaeospora TaxID=100035 RepID=A0A7C8IC23_9PLEO|nr:cryptococcal mannosyltransferase 1-domain-containing protein [Massariosphaeria phaeospora]